MGLNTSKGNMYDWITHTWNTVKGECYHNCSYCYMKRWGQLNPVRFDESELKTDLGEENFIFVGSSCDMWAENIPEEWIIKTLEHCAKYDRNQYLFQTKNPAKIRRILPDLSRVCITMETNRFFPIIMGKSPIPEERYAESKLIRHPLYITIEPIMYFDLQRFSDMLIDLSPEQINIGADSGKNDLPEPSKEEILSLITTLANAGLKIKMKKNLDRIINN